MEDITCDYEVFRNGKHVESMQDFAPNWLYLTNRDIDNKVEEFLKKKDIPFERFDMTHEIGNSEPILKAEDGKEYTGLRQIKKYVKSRKRKKL